ncbi:hypothetical protein Pelo_7228 [Pelomyxa schiedti]|nr:hypothetical protein Pelo_7228 [Pelomyxa schiedti]
MDIVAKQDNLVTSSTPNHSLITLTIPISNNNHAAGESLPLAANGRETGGGCIRLRMKRTWSAVEGTENAVVLAMSTEPGEDLCRGCIDKLTQVYGEWTAVENHRNTLVVNWGQKPVFQKSGFSLLAVAFTICAHKIISWSPNSETELMKLIDAILKTSGNHHCIVDTATSSPESVPINSPFFTPGTTTVDITEMPASIVQNLLQILHVTPLEWTQLSQQAEFRRQEGLPFSGERTKVRTMEKIMRRWVQVKNWSAVQELIMGNAVENLELDLSDLSLDCVPDQLKGISCRILNLQGNNITEPPQPVKHQKMILVGEPTEAKAAFVKCLMEKKNKLDIQGNLTTPPITVQGGIKFRRASYIWTVWNLGSSSEHPFHEFFFGSRSVFIVFFDSTLPKDENGGPQQKINFWLDEIARCQRRYRVSRRAGVLLFGCGSDQEHPTYIHDLLVTCYFSHIWMNMDFLGIVSVNYPYNEGYTFYEKGEHPVRINKPITKVIEMIEPRVPQGQDIPWLVYPLSPTWKPLEKALRRAKEKTMKWAEFKTLARQYGVGKRPGFPRETAQTEFKLCCEYLSDSGAIIHFRNDDWANSQLYDIVILQPSWFNDVLQVVTENVQEVASEQGLANFPDKYLWEKMAICAKSISGLSEHLMLTLDMIIFANGCNYLSPRFLPDPPASIDIRLNKIWGQRSFDHSREVMNGRVIELGCPRVHGLISGLVAMLSQVPSVGIKFVWKSGIQFGKFAKELSISPPATITQNLYISYPGTTDTSLDIYMHTIFNEACDTKELRWKNDMMAIVIAWLEQFAKDNHLPKFVQSFPCPHCLCELVESGSGKRTGNHYRSASVNRPLPEGFHFFKVPRGKSSCELYSLITENSGRAHLACTQSGNTSKEILVKLIDIAPELYLVLPTPGSSSPSTINPASATPAFPVTTHNKASTSPKIAEGNPARTEAMKNSSTFSTSTAQIPEQTDTGITLTLVSRLRQLPEHPKVAKIAGVTARQGSGNYYVSVAREVTPFIIPTHLREILGSCGVNPGNAIDLGQFLNSLSGRKGISGSSNRECTEMQRSSSYLMDTVLPMNLRVKILRDVAEGINHLHCQNPPFFIQGDLLDNGHVLITSLDDSRPEPMAKVLPLGTSTRRGTIVPKAVELFKQLPPKTDSGAKTDVWNFGMLVHKLIYPAAPLIHMETPADDDADQNQQSRHWLPLRTAVTPRTLRPAFAGGGGATRPLVLNRARAPPHPPHCLALSASPTFPPCPSSCTRSGSGSGTIPITSTPLSPAPPQSPLMQPTSTPAVTTTSTTKTGSGCGGLSNVDEGTGTVHHPQGNGHGHGHGEVQGQEGGGGVCLWCWAKQIVTCCWVVNPALRPSMRNILDICDHFLGPNDHH